MPQNLSQARNAHSGMDIAAATATPVRAPLAGRVTGPHRHWSVMLNRAMVDPALFIDA